MTFADATGRRKEDVSYKEHHAPGAWDFTAQVRMVGLQAEVPSPQAQTPKSRNSQTQQQKDQKYGRPLLDPLQVGSEITAVVLVQRRLHVNGIPLRMHCWALRSNCFVRFGIS